MFYFATLAGGVEESTAKLMYVAVYAGGPRWTMVEPQAKKNVTKKKVTKKKAATRPSYDETEVQDLKRWVSEDNPSLAEIEAELERLSAESTDPTR